MPIYLIFSSGDGLAIGHIPEIPITGKCRPNYYVIKSSLLVIKRTYLVKFDRNYINGYIR